MPSHCPRLCRCGAVVPYGTRCSCQIQRDQARKQKSDRRRPTARQRGYDATWEKDRAAFLKANPSCVHCGAPSTIVDHIKPHRGDRRLFLAPSNRQALCTTCHSSTKQREERHDS